MFAEKPSSNLNSQFCINTNTNASKIVFENNQNINHVCVANTRPTAAQIESLSQTIAALSQAVTQMQTSMNELFTSE